MAFEFDMTEFLRGIREAQEKTREAALRGMSQFGQKVIGDARELAPYGGGSHSPNDPAPGTLRESGTAEAAAIDGGGITLKLGFNTVYAAVQHENVDFGHDVGQAKYLSTAINANAPKMESFVGGFVKDAL